MNLIDYNLYIYTSRECTHTYDECMTLSPAALRFIELNVRHVLITEQSQYLTGINI